MQSKESKGARAREGGQRPLGPEDATENGRALLRRFVPGRVAALPARARSAAVKDLRENITKRVEAMSAALEELTPARSAAPRLPLLVYAGGSAGFLGLPMRPFSRRRRRAGRPRRLSIRHRTRGRSEGRAVVAYPQPGRAEVRFVIRDARRLRKRCMCTCRPCLSSPPPPGLRWAIRGTREGPTTPSSCSSPRALSLGSEPLVLTPLLHCHSDDD